jgi:hypothetical protein
VPDSAIIYPAKVNNGMVIKTGDVPILAVSIITAEISIPAIIKKIKASPPKIIKSGAPKNAAISPSITIIVIIKSIFPFSNP